MSIEMARVSGGGGSKITDDTSQPLLKNTEMKKDDEKRSEATLVESGGQNMFSNTPFDRYNLIMFFFILHGIGTLMPWNSFINANSYFTEYKLIVTHANGTQTPSEYQQFFLSNLGVVANTPGLLFNIINIFAPFKSNNYAWRIVPAIIIEICVMIFTIFLAFKDTSEWITGFFYSTIISVVILNLANGIYQNSIFGLASKFPMRYTNYVILGNNICGTFTALTNIVTLGASPNLRIAAIYYFISALSILLLAVDTFLALPVNRFYRFHVNPKIEESAFISKESIKFEEAPPSKPVPYCFIFSKCWKQCLNVFLVFFVTLSVFPVIQCNIGASNKELFGTTERTNKYYVAVFCFLVFNFFAMIGNLIPGYFTRPGPNHLWIPVVLRFAFIPFFLFCNLLPDTRSLPVYFDNDLIYLFGAILFAISSGYLSSLSMMYAPKSAPLGYSGIAAMMAGAFLMGGIFTGISVSPYIMLLVK